jgi:16S rRNA (guanine966-N2)-methyltransferase
VRIVGGELGGRRLAGAIPRGIRPTSDKTRESLFQLLTEHVLQTPFADLCAGSGAVGIEAWSRGARPVVMVERDAAACRLIERNLLRLGLESVPGLTVEKAEVGRWIRNSTWPGEASGPVTVFLDPPYGERRIAGWIAGLAAPGRLPARSLIVVEHASRVSPPWRGDLPLDPLWSKRYGDTRLSAALVNASNKTNE